MAIVAFDSTAFKTSYPVFVSVDNGLLTGCFSDAGLYLSNQADSPVRDLGRRTSLLWLLTAHIAYLGGALSADGMPLPVGRPADMSQGSVSVSLDNQTPGSAAWFQQTQWGASFWQATAGLRSFRYIPGPRGGLPRWP